MGQRQQFDAQELPGRILEELLTTVDAAIPAVGLS